MANLPRAPLFQRNQPRQNVVGWAAQNLLTTTLVVVVAAAPFQNNTIGQVQTKRCLTSETSAGTPKALYADPSQPAGEAQIASAPLILRINADTTQDIPKTLFGDQVSPAANVHGAAPVRPNFGYRTETGSPLPILTAVAGVPVIPYVHAYPIRSKWMPADASQPTPKALYEDEVIASSVPESQAPQLRLSRTSLAIYRNSATLDSVVAQVTFVPNLQPLVARRAVYADTTQDTPKTLFSDQSAAFVNPPHTQPDRVRHVFDTSRGSAKVLEFVAAPISNPHHTAPDRVRPVYDTSRGITKVLYGDQSIAFVNLPYPTPDRVRPVYDTSKGSDPNFIVQSATVPDVVGQTQADGTATLQAAGFVVNVQTQQSQTAAGIIVEEQPPGGTVVPYGSTVTIYVSLGPSQGAGRIKRKHERYIARYKGEDHEFASIEALEEFVLNAQQAEKKKPRQYRKPIKISLTPDFQQEIQEYVEKPVEFAKLAPSAALEQVKAIERRMNVEDDDDDDDEVLLWLM